MRLAILSLRSLVFVLVVVGLSGKGAEAQSAFETIEFRSIDGLTVTADLFETGDRADPLILAFHQSGSSRGEYRTIAPNLVSEGFNVLAVDLRWGRRDRWFEVDNETAERFGTSAIMDEADSGDRTRVWPTIFASYDDMLSAYDWSFMNDFTGKKIIAGSSASSVLVLKMPRDRAIDAVLSYSPGEYHDTDSTLFSTWASDLEVPTYIAAGSDEYDLSRPIFDAVGSWQKTFYLAPAGRHGASILMDDERNYTHLVEYLRQFLPGEEVVFESSDGVTIYGDLYGASDKLDGPVILLFHQGGGDARGEYVPIVGPLLATGATLLSIDQRRGGVRFGGENRTLAGIPEMTAYSYCDVSPDLDAALDFMKNRGHRGKFIAWGSSYSAALVIELAARRPDDIDAVLAFSPASGEPMAGCDPRDAKSDLGDRLLVLRPSRAMQLSFVAEQLDYFEENGHETYIARNGVHGSSMLNAARVQADVTANWEVVMNFLDRVMH